MSSQPHISPTETDRESLAWALEVARNLMDGVYPNVPSYEMPLAVALLRLEEQFDSLRSDYALLRGTLLQIEDMPVRIQLGNKLAENPAITHDLAARALNETQDSLASSPASRAEA